MLIVCCIHRFFKMELKTKTLEIACLDEWLDLCRDLERQSGNVYYLIIPDTLDLINLTKSSYSD